MISREQSGMVLWSSFLILTLHLHALQSKVQLKDNGFENIVIAINPLVPENQTLITNIKDMVTEASYYLFRATKRRFYFRDVKILVPDTWESNNHQMRKRESYEKASVIVAEPNLKYGDDPYTLQYGGCGEEGKHIHFTPNYLISDDLLPVYGSRGRVFVHEWAHLRWGLFDEYNHEKPFYISKENQIKATRCSADLTGMFVCERNSCLDGDCMLGSQTGHFEEGCTFLVDKLQNATASIMYMPALSSVVEFCNESTHDSEAPNLQNRMCDYQSTWDVIMRSLDYQTTSPMRDTALPSPPVFSLLQIRGRALCLVLDVSGSMAVGDRIHRLRQAAAVFLLQVVQTGSHVGIVTFNSTAEVKTPLREIINEDVRKQLTSYLPITAGGEKNICIGLLQGLQVTKELSGSTVGSELVLVTAGEDNAISSCFSNVTESGSVVHTIALGPKVSKELEKLANVTEGLKFFAPDRLDSSALIDAFSGLAFGNGDITHQVIQLESITQLVEPAQHLSGTVTFDHTAWNDTVFVVTWQASESPVWFVKDPSEKAYTSEDFIHDSVLCVAHLQIPGSTEAGDWTYQLINTFNSSQALSLSVTSRAADDDVPPVTVHAYVNKEKVAFPHPVVVYAEVHRGFSPVLGANVTAVIEPETGNSMTLSLADDGAGADVVKNDGIYSKYLFSFTENGRHNVKVYVQGKNKTIILGPIRSWNHAMYVPGYIDNGTIQMNPPKPLIDDDEGQVNIGGFSRTTTAGTFIVTEVPPGSPIDVFPPCKIIDLDVRIEDDNFHLSWTAPGDNYDQGNAASYEIRRSMNPLMLRDSFENAILVNTSHLTPRPTGFKETFSLLPQDLAFGNGTVLYFAIRAMDKASLWSDVSNIAQGTIFAQTRDTYSSSIANTTTSNVLTMLLIAIGTVASICLVLGATVCVLQKTIFWRFPDPMPQKNPYAEDERESVYLTQHSTLSMLVLSDSDHSRASTSFKEEEDEV
ncbi:calcium-activated chloride channel regulator 2-like [Rhinatrema bivittatum]|uniref:calcium-activated chloride channel regulator 2-like n=1 Tax=Rhinatrema bivittatum TaxID=194408 RepID=UPI00112D0FF5|nr:calcium-activated chloride channel regulator 2-like [Rhinatrema bivittatum]XP_029473622.1 calcium-activated chloride channel regulator 2-like [Rhinatrema bivittatum]XP_029473623.1 calcium-activated chloride channel regulator 2-like [Rhinatrema bivittatum]XP_029473624.1 calcium-activated chloride channel regulator 2-like [Rhinatrema bivittatum]